MSAPVENILTPVQSPRVENQVETPRASAAELRARTLLVLPVSVAIAGAVHWWAEKKQTMPEPAYYNFLGIVFVCAIVLAMAQRFSAPVRRWVEHNFPIFAGTIGLLTVWEIVTSGLRWLPLPYFPGPGGVLRSMIDDWRLLRDSTLASLIRLLAGYGIGVVIALITGVCIGWFRAARYWGMPALKVIGPIPATAWIPLAMVLSPNPDFTPIGLVAIAVWFPVTMLTVSGIANTRASYLDVARTLGASQKYLVFRVAIPAAMPNIFIGLFMGLGASFLTLVVAETVGVKSGLGWYIEWARNYAEYGKVFGALIIMAAFFSTIMTALFKVRDRVLVWQKGMIKW